MRTLREWFRARVTKKPRPQRLMVLEPFPGERWIVFPPLTPEERERLRQQALERANDSFMKALREHLATRAQRR